MPQTARLPCLDSVTGTSGGPNVAANWDEIDVVSSGDSQDPTQVSQKDSTVLEYVRIQRSSQGKLQLTMDSLLVPLFSLLLEWSALLVDLQYLQLCNPDRRRLHVCAALCGPDRHGREIGFLVDEAPDKNEHRLYRANSTIDAQASSRSLENLLASHRDSGDGGLSRKTRLQIAVILASSVLRLDGISWLKTGWSSGDVCFHQKNGRLSMTENVDPYLSWQPCCHARTCPLERQGLEKDMVQSKGLLALGLTLIGLCFGRTLTAMRKPEDLNGTIAMRQ